MTGGLFRVLPLLLMGCCLAVTACAPVGLDDLPIEPGLPDGSLGGDDDASTPGDPNTGDDDTQAGDDDTQTGDDDDTQAGDDDDTQAGDDDDTQPGDDDDTGPGDASPFPCDDDDETPLPGDDDDLAVDDDDDGIARPLDCDDADPTIHPGAQELCDGKDNDCDGLIDDQVPVTTWYKDGDGDGYGRNSGIAQACASPDGYVDRGGDCDDSSAETFPGAPELCDGKDNNCNTLVDDGTVFLTYYHDGDGDGYGTHAVTTVTCGAAPPDFTSKGGDCNDGDRSVYPGAPEVCDGKDNDCDGVGDPGVSTWYADEDRDGYGDPDVSSTGCSRPAGYVSDDSDCDDAEKEVHPGASEKVCNGIDEDCSGMANDHPDADGDGYDVCPEDVPGSDGLPEDCDDKDPEEYPDDGDDDDKGKCKKNDDIGGLPTRTAP